MELLVALATATAVGVGLGGVELWKRFAGQRRTDRDGVWRIAADKLGLDYVGPHRARMMSGRYEGFYVRATTQPDPDQVAGRVMVTYTVELRGPLQRFTVVRTGSFMNPRDRRLDTGDDEFDRELVVIRPVRAGTEDYFTPERRRLILELFAEFRQLTFTSSRLEVTMTEQPLTAEELVVRVRALVRAARALSIETDRRGQRLN